MRRAYIVGEGGYHAEDNAEGQGRFRGKQFPADEMRLRQLSVHRRSRPRRPQG
jgi:hypothetical protein